MAAAITIQPFDKAAPELKERLAKAEPAAIAKAIREDMVTAVRSHIAKLDAERPNRLGGERTHFYEQAANSVTHEVQDTLLRISIGHLGFRQRFQGGVIRARNAKFLTVPATKETHGKRAGEFANLRFAVLEEGGPALIDTPRTDVTFGRKRKDGSRSVKGTVTHLGVKVMYWLRRSVTQQADPSVLPTADELKRVAIESARDYLDTLTQGGAA